MSKRPYICICECNNNIRDSTPMENTTTIKLRLSYGDGPLAKIYSEYEPFCSINFE